MGETLNEFSSLIPRLNEHRLAKSLMEVFPRTIQFNLRGEDGPFCVQIRNSQMAISKQAMPAADLVVSGDGKEFAKVVSGKIDFSHPMARGQITVDKGKASELMLLNRILVAINSRSGR